MNHKIQCLITSVDNFKDPKLFQQGLALLPDFGSWKERKESISRLRRQESRLESLGAGLMLRTLLLKNSLPLEALSVSEKGKPFLKDHDFHFNLSHSNGYVVCAFGSAPCGIDIQKEREDRSNIARIFFTESEYALVQEHGVSMFTRIWALKESYVKYTGRGIDENFGTFSVLPDLERRMGLPDFWEKEGRRMTDFGTFLLPFHRLHYMGGRRAGISDNFP